MTSPVSFHACDCVETQTKPEQIESEHGREEQLRYETVLEEVAYEDVADDYADVLHGVGAQFRGEKALASLLCFRLLRLAALCGLVSALFSVFYNEKTRGGHS